MKIHIITSIKRLLALTLAGLGSSAFAGGNVLPPQSHAFGASYAEWSAKCEAECCLAALIG